MKCLLVVVAAFATLITSGNLCANQKTIVETAVEAGNFKTLVTAVKAAGLVETLNGHSEFTVFAPTDAAFAHLDQSTLESLLQPESKSQLAQILTYHVLPGRVWARDAYDLNSTPTVNGQRLPLDFRGDSLRVGDAKISVTDIECSNGVIHVIDSVLMPNLDSIPATAKAAGQFETLLAAVGAAGLADVLSGPGPFTVFAPTDDAFAALPDGTVDSLLKPENKQKLVDILKYHVIAGRVYDNDAVQSERAETLLSRSLNIRLSASGIKVNESQVLMKNIDTSNGVVHVIDSVLIPSSMTSQELMSTLNDAVRRGVPIFNAGHHGQCCDIYMATMKSIMSAGIENADEHTMSLIESTIERANDTHDVTERAWVLRRGIDSLYSRSGKMSDQVSSGAGTGR